MAAGADASGPAFSPLYQQIKTLMTRSLQAGVWRPGEAIPSEKDLAARFRVSQGTVRKAVDELAAELQRRLLAVEELRDQVRELVPGRVAAGRVVAGGKGGPKRNLCRHTIFPNLQPRRTWPSAL